MKEKDNGREEEGRWFPIQNLTFSVVCWLDKRKAINATKNICKSTITEEDTFLRVSRKSEILFFLFFVADL